MKKITAIIIVGMFLLVSLNAISINVTASTIEKEEYEDVLPVMWVDNEFLGRYENDYTNEEVAFINPTLASEVQATTDYSVLDLLYYIPEERTQGGCANCWAWPSTSVIEIALRVQEGVMENRLSVQYMNTCGELYPTTDIGCCQGGTLSMCAAFYRLTGIAIPWSNENAHWQDYVLIGQCNQVECDEIAKDPNYPISSIKSNTIKIRGVPEQTAIDNIKNILHQNRGVFFTIFYPDETNIYAFRDFWRYETEESIYDLDYYAGHPWVDEEGAGHALLLVGYHDDEDTDTNDYWIMLNSWGTTADRSNGLLRIDMHMNYSLTYSGQSAFGAETLNVTFGSDAPTTSITGPTSGRKNKDYTFDISAVDPQGDDVYLYVKWGDGTTTDWLGPYDSGEVIQLSHSFPERINYTIKAKAKDIDGNEGKEQPLLITMLYKYKPIFQFFESLFNRLFPNAVPFLGQPLGYFISYAQKTSSKPELHRC
jgi:C1A family cysteine protease